MNKLMAVAVLLGMSFFAVEASAGPMNAKAAKKVFDGISRRAGTVVMGKRGAEHIYHEYRDYRDSVDREGLYLDRARLRNFDNQGYVDGSQSELFIRNPYASQDDKKPIASQNEADALSEFLERRSIDRHFFEQGFQPRRNGNQGYNNNNLAKKDIQIYAVDPIITRSAALFPTSDETCRLNSRRPFDQDDIEGTLSKIRSRHQENSTSSNDVHAQQLNFDYSVNFLPDL